MTETVTVCLSLTAEEAKALHSALKGTREGLGLVILEAEGKYDGRVMELLESHSEVCSDILSAYEQELETVNNGKKIAEKAGIQL